MRLIAMLTLTVSVAAVGCGEHEMTSAGTMLPDAGAAMSSMHLMCPSQDGGTSVLPEGECVGTGNCVVALTAKCEAGVRFVPLEPPIYRCQCEHGAWTCDVTAGGLGIRSCPDSGLLP